MVAVTIWNEYRHEQQDGPAKDVYPDGIHEALANALSEHGHDVRTAMLDEPEHGLTEQVFEETEVLIWWGHLAHDEVANEIISIINQ